jgi:mannose/cellobiose epimerase-like protein (N-acyl-D-glucosamine 2-epimerase family)
VAEDFRANVRQLQEWLQHWLIYDACPLWSTYGFDSVRGGFHERLDGTQALDEPRRARVQPRQVSALSNAVALGWKADAAKFVNGGLDYFFSQYRRPDGLYRTLIAADGRAVDDRVFLYDQAFALLGLADSQLVLGCERGLAEEAQRLRAGLYRFLKHPDTGFESTLASGDPLSANAHMHLLEAGLAWRASSNDAGWDALCNEIGNLALTHFIDARTGIVREHFTSDWSVMPGMAGRVIEPGHHYEWAWLLLQWAGGRRGKAASAALRLIDIGERHGVRDGFVVNSLLDDYSVLDGASRLWPQAERLRVASFMAGTTGESRHWRMADEAGESLRLYLHGKVAGSWHDRRTPHGRFMDEPAPASTFYHIVGAIKALTAAVSVDERKRA